MLLEKEGEVSSLLAFTLRQIIPFVSNLHCKDVLYFFSIQFSPFSCFSSISKIWHFEVFWAREVKLLFDREPNLFSSK